MGKCNYTYVANTIASYKSATELAAPATGKLKVADNRPVTGTYKDDDSKYTLENLLLKQEKGGNR